MSLKTTVTTAAADSVSDQLFLVVVSDEVHATHALPRAGKVVIGRAAECEVRIDDGSISRTHAVLFLDEPLRISDKGSANGTWVRDRKIAADEPLTISINEAIRIGGVTVIVQRRSVNVPRRRIRTHDYFENRLEDECERAARHNQTFVALHIVSDDDTAIHDDVAGCLREQDIVAAYAPGELEVLLVDAEPRLGNRVVHEIEAALVRRGIGARIGSAWYPRDGRDASALAARARSRAIGPVTSAVPQDVVVADERMSALHQLVARVAATDINVLLLGETGVGKEVIAEQLHRNSARAEKPFIKLNCAALTEGLLESELFGHERGAFTGAVAPKPGLLEVAEGGVFFLDEIGELSPTTQAKLLRVLDERKLTRVGGVTARAIDVRIVSATNRDLDAEVARGAFRLDLLYRLNAMSLIIPPLRERVSEIVPLAHRFLHGISAKLGRPVSKLSDGAISLLHAYSWPGNVRELRNVIERAMILSTGRVIDVGDLPVDKMRATFTSRPSPAQPLSDVGPTTPPELDLDERQQILDALDACGGNQTHAARLLGIARRTLINKLEKFAMPRPRKKQR